MNGIQADLQWTHCLLIIVVKENQLYKIQVDLDKDGQTFYVTSQKTGQVNLSRQGELTEEERQRGRMESKRQQWELWRLQWRAGVHDRVKRE